MPVPAPNPVSPSGGGGGAILFIDPDAPPSPSGPIIAWGEFDPIAEPEGRRPVWHVAATGSGAYELADPFNEGGTIALTTDDTLGDVADAFGGDWEITGTDGTAFDDTNTDNGFGPERFPMTVVSHDVGVTVTVTRTTAGRPQGLVLPVGSSYTHIWSLSDPTRKSLETFDRVVLASVAGPVWRTHSLRTYAADGTVASAVVVGDDDASGALLESFTSGQLDALVQASSGAAFVEVRDRVLSSGATALARLFFQNVYNDRHAEIWLEGAGSGARSGWTLHPAREFEEHDNFGALVELPLGNAATIGPVFGALPTAYADPNAVAETSATVVLSFEEVDTDAHPSADVALVGAWPALWGGDETHWTVPLPTDLAALEAIFPDWTVTVDGHYEGGGHFRLIATDDSPLAHIPLMPMVAFDSTTSAELPGFFAYAQTQGGPAGVMLPPASVLLAQDGTAWLKRTAADVGTGWVPLATLPADWTAAAHSTDPADLAAALVAAGIMAAP